MNSSLTAHYEAMVQQALVETRMATREAGLAVAQAKITDSKVEWFKWMLSMMLTLILSTQFYFSYTITSRLDRVVADLNALTVRMDRLEVRVDRLEVRVDGLEVRMDGLEAEVHQLAVRQQEHNDLYRHTEK